MNIIVIIQARMGSTRLPGKVLMPLGDSCVLDYVVERCKLIQPVAQVIVATSTRLEDDPIASWCSSHDINCFRGEEDNVLSRYYDCAKVYQPEYIIRVTADCPFVDYHFANLTVEAMRNHPSDIVINRQQSELTRGLSVELISFLALERIYQASTEERHREHVTYYAYEYPDQFEQTVINVPDSILYPDLRMTIDTEEDYRLCSLLAERWKGCKDMRSDELIAYLLDHPEIAQINAHIMQKPVM
ncbi:glycosyltransferase family protein [Paenibacillus vini]|uniref:glycosyltransferase family protein n=1 Tax=Paenibacillus vini TaxID=1476024 RepID=UPI0025B6FAFB|nr:glycosyltransferase family protein [Paenibacillus vini]MDN4066462.1 glycosyltransferase family protein [Paenibacillus vini]